MNRHGEQGATSVTVADPAGTPNAAPPRDVQRDTAAADVLTSHAGVRIVVFVAIAVLQLGLLHRITIGAGLDRTIIGAGAAVSAYVVAVMAMRTTVRRRGRATPMLVAAALLLDLILIFALTLLTTTPDHYERALFGTIVVVHVANYFYGRRHAWRVVQVGIVGYLLLIATAATRGMRVEVAEEVWTLALCAAATTLSVVQASDVRRRLRNIVTLFEFAEVGDFSRAYDAAADGRPDAITRVGVAYNGVRAQLANMVLTDPLTRCLNRRGFDNALTRELSRASRAGSPFALLAIDLDHFKQVNDTYGHLAGDVVLRATGNLLMTSARAGDVVARVGGEEFAVLLADTAGDGAQLFATRLCERIASHAFEIGAEYPAVHITTSIGIASASTRAAGDLAELLWSRADDALYEAKRAGRNRVHIWTGLTRRSGEHTAIRGTIGEAGRVV